MWLQALNDIIEMVRFSGDFLVIPEEAIDALENRLIGISLKDPNPAKRVVGEELSKTILVDDEDLLKLLFEGCRQLAGNDSA